MKKVLVVFNHPAPYKVRLFNELAKYFDLHVIFERTKAKDRNNKFYFEKNFNFVCHRIKGIPIGKEGTFSNGVVRHLRKNTYDLIIMNGYSHYPEMLAIRYLKKHKIPYVLYINGGIIAPTESKFKEILKTILIEKATAYFSPDETSSKYLTYYGAEESKIHLYPYSTIYDNEIVCVPFDKQKLRTELSIPNGKIFVSSGQLIKRKNYSALIYEWRNLPVDYQLFILGDGPEKKRLLNLINEFNLKNVHLLGFMNRNDSLKYIRAADVFVFPSKEDIYGHVINESLSQGVPVISTMNVNSAIKLIQNGKNGFLLDLLCGDQFKNAIDYCLKNDLTINCINTAKDNTIELMTSTFVEIINKVIK